MPPKSLPKLTKKQLQEQQKEEMKKKEAEEAQRKRIQEQKMIEQRKIQMIEEQKRMEQQRIRILDQKYQYADSIKQRVKNQQQANHKIVDEQQWSNFTTQYFKSFDISPPKLSAFISIFQQTEYIDAQKTLQECQESQIYIQKLYEKMLMCRSEYKTQQQQKFVKAIIQLRKIQMNKLQEIMVRLANSAEDIQDKNGEINKNKGQVNKRNQGKITQQKHYMSKNFKIGMFLNSNTVKVNYKFKPIQIKQFGHNTQIPTKWMTTNSIVKFEWVNFNPYSPQIFQPFIIIGGIYNIQFYELLLGSKKIKNFIVKKYFKGKQILEKLKLAISAAKQPFYVVYQIPKYVFLPNDQKNNLRVAQYDSSTMKWSLLPPDSVVEYQTLQKKIKCRISRPQPIAYVQQRCLDYPYITWELKTIERGIVQLDIQLKRYLPQNLENFTHTRLMVKFQIRSNTVKLIMDKNYPELKELSQQINTPEYILHKLSCLGIHLLPVDEDYLQAKLPKKNRQAEKSAIRDIAYAVQSFYIRSVPNNTNNIEVKIRQNLDYESVFLQDQEKDWKYIRWSDGDKCQVTNRNIKQRHLNFQVLLQQHNFTSEQCLERIKYDRDYLLRKTIIKMLQLTRILSFVANEPSQTFLVQNLKNKLIVK